MMDMKYYNEFNRIVSRKFIVIVLKNINLYVFVFFDIIIWIFLYFFYINGYFVFVCKLD